MIGIGERLRSERIQKNITLEEVAKATKIRVSFLDAIEKGAYEKLPSGTYAHGFVKNYAEFLKLPTREVLALFRREFDEEKYFKVLPEGLAKQNDFPLRKIRVQQTVIVIGLLFCILLGFIVFQYRGAFINPPLILTTPKANAKILSQSLTVVGKTDPNATVTVNDKSVSLDTQGNFRKEVTLFPGSTTIKVQATNRFGKRTEIERKIVVTPQ